ncbi:alpha-2-macroglobulin family protein [Tolypothrix bouteillei VB521301]|uniref:Alpha-2-macroglobulin family protein n=1 Tax=Tolypothrix bouteillei VB521301 TaxID=1479485 RepID=A0A8S9THF8_9CYAN|nr:alpha-2-macroglobulin family protein [Tolypothrix bouteillei VB521301]
MRFLLVLTLMLGIAGCGFVSIAPRKEQLPTVSVLNPPQLPDWIEQISPLSDSEPLNQIRIRFKEALIPVESLDSAEQQGLLKKFEIVPSIPGHFRFLTPRMVGFQVEEALPKATRFQVTLKAGLADLKNHRLNQDLAWTFNTELIKLTDLPGKNPIEKDEIEPIDLQQKLQFTSNTELNLASVRKHLQLLVENKTQNVPFKVELAKEEKTSETQDPLEKFDPSSRQWIYNLIPQESLQKATHYRLEFSPGLLPAYGNLPSEQTFASKLSTYSPLEFRGLQFYGQPDASGTYGRFVQGAPQLVFNNELAASSVIENIKINPAPQAISRIIQANDREKVININPYAFSPSTSYTITIGANIKDKFGQTLGKPITVKYETGDLAGDLWVPEGLNIFPDGKNLQLNISTVNLPDSSYKAAYQVVQPTDLVYFNSAYPKSEGNNLLPQISDWKRFKVSGKKNQSLELSVPIREKLGAATGMLAYGVQARTNTYKENGKELWREPATYGMVQMTNLGVFTQWFPESGLIRVHHLSDGSPAKAAAIAIYQSKLEAKSRPQPVPCASGKTDENGTLRLARDDLRECFAGSQSSTKEPLLLVIAREDRDWAFARTEEYSGAYGYGIDASWEDSKFVSRGVIFSDRQLYQPGEKAWLTGFADYLQNGEIKQDKNAIYQLTLIDPDGQKIDLGTKNTNEFGTFSLELPIKKNQRLGYYTIQAKGKNGQEISGELRVAEFNPPNFKVELNLDKEFAFLDDKVEVQSTSQYLFGSPVEGGQAKYFVTRQQTNFVPKGWEEFTFGKQWFWPEEPPSVPSDVLQANASLDANGKSNQTVVAKDLPYPMIYRVDVQVADVSNLSVANSKTFTALPSDRQIGLKSNFVGEASKDFPFEVIVTDHTGKPQEGQRVLLELQQMKYSNVTQLVEGSATGKTQVEYKTVEKAEITSANKPQSVTLKPNESGSYRIRANFSDARNDTSATDIQIWVTGENPVFWGNKEKDRLEIQLDKTTFKPGETVTALIQSPYSEGELYFAVIKDKPLYQQIVKVKGGAPKIQFQVTPEMLPNAAIEAVLVRQGTPLDRVEPKSLTNLARIGFAPFKVNLDDKYLKVQATPVQASLEPGAEQTVQLELKDNRGNPSKGQFTVMVVNEAVLQLSGYRPPDLVATVYAEQPISTRFSDNRQNVVVEQQALAEPKGWGYGGGLSAGTANTRIRRDFQALAYYNGSAIADSNGQAQISFKVPDNLTTWRVMVVATDGNLRFGNSEATFITTKPLVTNAILPQFARPGDTFQAGLSVTNNTRTTGNLTINGEVSGTVQFVGNNPTSAALQTQSDGATRAYRFPMVASRVGEGKVRFTTQINSASADAFEVPLAIQQLEMTEQVVETGAIVPRKNEVKIPLNIEKNTFPEGEGLDINLASTLIPEIKAPVQQVWENDDFPFAEPSASQLFIAAGLQTLSEKYGQTFAAFNPSKRAYQAIEKLQKLQLADGGFAAFPGEQKADPWVSSYAAESLAKADRSFPGLVDSNMVSRLKTYLQKTLANPGQYEFCKKQPCKSQLQLNALMALAELGDKRNTFLADIYRQRNAFDLSTQMKLTRYLSQFPEWQNESKQLLSKLQQNVYYTSRDASVSLPSSWEWMNSPTAIQAQALRLFIALQYKPEAIDRLLQSLLALRRKGTWQTHYDNAQALTALVEYSQLQPTPPNFVATVRLAGQKLGQQKFEGYRNPTLEVKVPMAELPRGRHDLQLQKSGQGTLHYLVAYRYRLQGNQPGRFNGLRVTREISPVGQDKVLQKVGLYAKDKPLTVTTGQVFDIGLEVIADRPVNHLVITDPLPAGFEAVDESFQTATAALQAKADSWQLGFKAIHRDRAIAYADSLEPGVYQLHYLVRSVTPGTFLYPGAQVHLQYAPEEFGRTSDATLVVQ